MLNRRTIEGPARARSWRDSFGPGPILLTLLVAGMIGCSETEPPDADPYAELRPRITVPTPTVERDLEEIRDSGVLRVLLRNSSSSYYVMQGEEWGFEFELAREIARELDLRLQVVLPDSQVSPLDLLNLGRVDLVGMPLRPEAAPDAEVAYTAPYHTVHQTLVAHADHADSIRTPGDLQGLMVAARHFSSGEQALFDLRRRGIAVGIVMHPPDTSTEEMLDLVADGTYPAAVANDSDVEAILRFREGLVEAFDLSEEREVHWAVRANAPQLLDAVDRILGHHFRLREDGSRAGSEFYNVVHARYFADETQMRRHEENPFRFARTGRLSPHDDLFKSVAEEVDLDWRLIAAVAFQESRFDPQAVSWAGAVGLMQVLPRTAGVSDDSLKVPEVNVSFGAEHLRRLYDAYSFVTGRDRLRFALAAYNCGQGHLDDARILSVLRGKDPNRWEGSVRESLLLLRRPQYHRQVRYGYVRGHETVGYVREVLRRYDVIRSLSPPRRTTTERASFTVMAEPAN